MFWVYFIAVIELLICYIVWKSTLVRNSETEEWHRIPIPRWQVIFSIIVFCIPVFNWFLIANWGITGTREDNYKYVMWKFPKIAEWFNKPMIK